jgi:hypothetical protein
MNFTAQSIKPTVQFNTAEISIIDDDAIIKFGNKPFLRISKIFPNWRQSSQISATSE